MVNGKLLDYVKEEPPKQKELVYLTLIDLNAWYQEKNFLLQEEKL